MRGPWQSGIQVHAGAQPGDIDPHLERGYCDEISDHAEAIGGAVLKAIRGARGDIKLCAG
jgi:hypothetical protein